MSSDIFSDIMKSLSGHGFRIRNIEVIRIHISNDMYSCVFVIVIIGLEVCIYSRISYLKHQVYPSSAIRGSSPTHQFIIRSQILY